MSFGMIISNQNIEKKVMLHGYIELYRLDNIINYKNSVNYKTKRPLSKEKK